MLCPSRRPGLTAAKGNATMLSKSVEEPQKGPNMNASQELTIRPASIDELEEIVAFYYDIIDHQDEKEFGADWTKDVYPSRQDFRTALENGEMHIGTAEGRIACGVILSGDDDIYKDVLWPTDVAPEEVGVMHLLAVHDDFAGRGFAKKLVAYSADVCRRLGKKAIRLDVIKGNLPAENLYLSCGFGFVAEQKIYYEDTGFADFRMFEMDLTR